MELVLFCVLVTIALVLTARADRNWPVRDRQNLNREWKFRAGNSADAEAVLFDDTKWENVQWYPFAGGTAFPVGDGWYRKQLVVPRAWLGKRLYLDFEGAFQTAEIFLNGKKVGEHRGGYAGFEVEITDAAKVGSNVLTVRVSNLRNASWAQTAGEHQFSGGLYRNVWLVAVDPLHVTWCGVSVTTPEHSAASGLVNVKTEVFNQSGSKKECRLRTEVLDPGGAIVASEVTSRNLVPGEKVIFDQTTSTIAFPQLMSFDGETLYSIVSKVENAGRQVDLVVTPFCVLDGSNGLPIREFLLNRQHR